MRELHLTTRLVDATLVDVDDELPELEPASCRLDRFEPRAAQMGRHAGHQLPDAQRLRHIIVGADLEGDDDVDLVRSVAHHDHRHSRIRFAELPANIEARPVRERHLQQHEAGSGGAELAKAVRAAVGFQDLVAILGAGCPDLAAGARVPVDDQDLAGCLGRADPSLLTDLKDC